MNTGGLDLSGNGTDVVTVTYLDVGGDGEFNCPKCKVKVSPDIENEWEEIEIDVDEGYLLIKHLCGQKIKIVVKGMPLCEQGDVDE